MRPPPLLQLFRGFLPPPQPVYGWNKRQRRKVSSLHSRAFPSLPLFPSSLYPTTYISTYTISQLSSVFCFLSSSYFFPIPISPFLISSFLPSLFVTFVTSSWFLCLVFVPFCLDIVQLIHAILRESSVLSRVFSLSYLLIYELFADLS